MNFLKALIESFSKKTESTSPAGKIDVVDVGKTLKEAGYIGLAAGIAFLLEKVPTLNIGEFQPLMVPVVTAALTLALKFVRDHTK